MNRFGSAVERLVVLIVGAALLVAGVGAVAWYQDWFLDADSVLDASQPLEWSETDWWPWAVGGAGVVLILIGLAWLAAPLRRPLLRRIRLADSSGEGRLTVDSSTLADAALAELDAAPGVSPRSGRVVKERKAMVIELRAAIDPGAELDEATDAAQHAASVLGGHLGAADVARCRVVLSRGGAKAKMSRVR